MMTNISILGSTGSIGRQSVAVAQRLGIRVSALAAFDNIGLLEEQALRLRPDLVAVYDAPAAAALHDRLSGAGIPVLSGMEGGFGRLHGGGRPGGGHRRLRRRGPPAHSGGH
jgi:1-deoxy-D-xylulose-5-phosphate reductoisomerase